jgi:protein ImuA
LLKDGEPREALMQEIARYRSELDSLRNRIRNIEGLPRATNAVLSMGLEAIDQALPWGGLPLSCIHHVVGESEFLPHSAFTPSASTFVAILAARLKGRGTVLWCLPRHKVADALYAAALAVLGLEEEDLILVRAKDESEALWAMEEGLCCPDVGAVIGSLSAPLNLTAERRLQLAAERGETTGFLLQPGTLVSSSSAAVTRWRVAAAPSEEPLWAGLGPPRWSLTLDRCRQGTPHSWIVEWCDETCNLRLATPLCDRSVNPVEAAA